MKGLRAKGVLSAAVCAVAVFAILLPLAKSQQQPSSRDAVSEAQTVRQATEDRPEQQKSAHDRMDPTKAQASSPVFKTQPKEGMITGFDFVRDPLNAERPKQTLDDIIQK